MLSLVGSLLGFGTSIIPKVMGYFEAKRDQKFELECMEKQKEISLAMGNQKMQMVNIDADIKEPETLHKEHTKITVKSSQWVINISALVRPCLTFFLFGEFVLLTFLLAGDYITSEMYSLIWSENSMAPIFSAVIGFYFGQRTFGRK